jgi:hypothetical protein
MTKFLGTTGIMFTDRDKSTGTRSLTALDKLFFRYFIFSVRLCTLPVRNVASSFNIHVHRQLD